MKRNQGGMTLIGFLITLMVVGVFIYMGMKTIPMYSEYYSVKSALKGLSTDPAVAEGNPAKLKDLFFRRLYISYSDNVKPEHVKIVRKDSGHLMTVDYEVRRPLIANLDIVGKFHAEQELRRGATAD